MAAKVCIRCGNPLPKHRWRYCSYECYKAQRGITHPGYKPYGEKSRSTTGAISELRAAVDLMIKGYDVFRALSPACPCDLAALKDGRTLRMEVRTTQESIAGKPYTHISKRDDINNIDHYVWILPDEVVYDPPLK